MSIIVRSGLVIDLSVYAHLFLCACLWQTIAKTTKEDLNGDVKTHFPPLILSVSQLTTANVRGAGLMPIRCRLDVSSPRTRIFVLESTCLVEHCHLSLTPSAIISTELTECLCFTLTADDSNIFLRYQPHHLCRYTRRAVDFSARQTCVCLACIANVLHLRSGTHHALRSRLEKLYQNALAYWAERVMREGRGGWGVTSPAPKGQHHFHHPKMRYYFHDINLRTIRLRCS